MSIESRLGDLEIIVRKMLRRHGCDPLSHEWQYKGQYTSSNGSPLKHKIYATCKLCEKEIKLIEYDD